MKEERNSPPNSEQIQLKAENCKSQAINNNDNFDVASIQIIKVVSLAKETKVPSCTKVKRI